MTSAQERPPATATAADEPAGTPKRRSGIALVIAAIVGCGVCLLPGLFAAGAFGAVGFGTAGFWGLAAAAVLSAGALVANRRVRARRAAGSRGCDC